MELRHLHSFLTVAAAGSVSAAARRLNIAQPAVSQHIRMLELELNVRLFKRTSRGSSLTDEGLALLAPAKAIAAAESDLRVASRALLTEARTEVQIAITPAISGALTPSALKLLTSDAARMNVYERSTTECLGLLAGRIVELAIVRDCEESAFDLDPLFSDPLVLATPRRAQFAHDERAPLAAVADAPFLTFGRQGSRGLHEAVMDLCSNAGFVPNVVCTGLEFGSMGLAIAAGLGVAIIPRSTARLWQSQEVLITELEHSSASSTVYVATLPGQPLSESALRLVRCFRRAAQNL